MNFNLKILLQLTAMLEMLIANLLAVNSCLNKKYSKFRTVAVYIIFTVVSFGATFYMRSINQISAPKSGINIIFGIVYIIPIYFLYTDSLLFKLSVMFTTWIYTMSAYSFSIRVALLFDSAIYEIVLLIVQSLFYLLTIQFFLKFINKKMTYILKNVKSGTRKSLLLLSTLWFGFFWLSTYSFVTPNSHFADLALVCIFLVSALLTYHLLYSSLLHQNSADHFRENLNIDPLTELKNRRGLNDDIHKLIKENHPFSLFFMDIDHLKSINDTYGHLTGDKYLKAFADSIKSLIDRNAEFYRIAGDEFVCIYTGKAPDKAFTTLSEAKFKSFDCSIPFGGVSIGRADYPKDGLNKNQILSVADEAMYKNKKRKNKN